MKFEIKIEKIAPVLLLIACFTTFTAVTSAPATENSLHAAIPPENKFEDRTGKNLLAGPPQFPQIPLNNSPSPYYQYPVPPNPFYQYPDGGFYSPQPSNQNGVNGYNPYASGYQYPYRNSYQPTSGNGYQNPYGNGYQNPYVYGYQNPYAYGYQNSYGNGYQYPYEYPPFLKRK